MYGTNLTPEQERDVMHFMNVRLDERREDLERDVRNLRIMCGQLEGRLRALENRPTQMTF